MRIAISQINPTIGAIEKNVEKIIYEINRAKKEGIDCIVFPELCITGYCPDDLLLQSGFIESVEKALNRIIETANAIVCIVGLPRRNELIHGKPLYNSAAVIINGVLAGFQDKILLPNYDVFCERRYFQPAPKEVVWKINDKKVGITICEDIWSYCDLSTQEKYPYDPLKIFDKEPIDLHINISASPYSVNKIETRTTLVKDLAKRLNCTTILCNQVGGQDSLIFDGTSIVASQSGEILLQAKSFEEDFIIFDTESQYPPKPSIIQNKPEEIYSALVLGVKDYFEKQGFKKACIGLSGGIDSTLVAAIATTALGKENVLGILLPSRFTSRESTEDGFHIASNLGISSIEIPIESIFCSFLDTLSSVFIDKPADITEENIQSRIRGMILMAISNKLGYLLLNTGNKSEIAIGYTTLYGDSCGAISVIGDLLKGDVYEVSRFISQKTGWIPPRILNKAPTAELRENQKDTDSIPEYPILDAIITEYVVNQRSVDEIVKKYDLSKHLVDDIISKIHKNEYKRRQTPFAIRISDKSFSCGRKVPIVHTFH